MAEPRTYPEGVTSWVDVEAPDLEAAQAFYGGLFGWTFEQASARLRGRPARRPGRRGGRSRRGRPGVEHLRRGRRRRSRPPRGCASRRPGARAVRPLPATPAGRRLRRPGRRTFPAVAGRHPPGAQLVNAPGAWNFSDLLAADPATRGTFYAAGVRLGDRRHRLRLDDPAAGVRRPPRRDGRPGHPRAAGRRSRCRPASPTRSAGSRRCPTATSAALARRLHGRRPGRDAPTPPNGSAAPCCGVPTPSGRARRVVRDPQGAVFTVSQFTPPA